MVNISLLIIVFICLYLILADVREPENTLWQPYDLRQTPMTDFLFNVR
jgi:hypothetical protein